MEEAIRDTENSEHVSNQSSSPGPTLPLAPTSPHSAEEVETTGRASKTIGSPSDPQPMTDSELLALQEVVQTSAARQTLDRAYQLRT